MGSRGRSERIRVGSDGGRTRYQGGTYQGYVMKRWLSRYGTSQAEWHREMIASARKEKRAEALFYGSKDPPEFHTLLMKGRTRQ